MMNQNDEMDTVFKALADTHRRLLLDLLFQKDGQTLLELQQYLPMTRFGCMKHLKVLEEAGLVASRKVGREKLHYLNPVPIQLIQERWVNKYAKPWLHGLLGLKFTLEGTHMNQKPSRVYEIFIRTTPDRLWQALTDGEFTRQYYYNGRVESTWEPGAPYCYRNPEGGVDIEGTIVEVDPPRRLVMTFTSLWDPQVAKSAPSTITWEIVSLGEACKLTAIHEDFDLATFDAAGLHLGWVQILSGLKTLLETGCPLLIEN